MGILKIIIKHCIFDIVINRLFYILSNNFMIYSDLNQKLSRLKVGMIIKLIMIDTYIKFDPKNNIYNKKDAKYLKIEFRDVRITEINNIYISFIADSSTEIVFNADGNVIHLKTYTLKNKPHTFPIGLVDMVII